MKFCLYAYEVSPHLMPLAREMVKRFGVDEVRYVYTKSLSEGRSSLGWKETDESWIINKNNQTELADRWLKGSDILLCERRDLDLWEYRAKSGKGLFYTSERWFKPLRCNIPGWLRLFSPSFLKMSIRAGALFRKYNTLIYLSDGIYAAEDFIKVCYLSKGQIWRAIKARKLVFEKRPGGRIEPSTDYDSFPILMGQLRMWGYFVAQSEVVPGVRRKRCCCGGLKVLWVGRFLGWKRVDTIIKAVAGLSGVELSIFGIGPMEHGLRRLVKRKHAPVTFHAPVPIAEVRKLMREYDVYVLSSNASEGWGAVVNEALEEGMDVFGTYEAGASMAILPQTRLFHCGDWRALRRMLMMRHVPVGIGNWSVACAADVLSQLGLYVSK